MYTMKDVCQRISIPYETLRFYCNEGLVPNVKRSKNNYRLFDDRDIQWLSSLQCLRRCGMGIQDMKRYLNLCLLGAATIPERKAILAAQQEILRQKMEEVRASMAYIDEKQRYFDGVLAGEIEYTSNLIDVTP